MVTCNFVSPTLHVRILRTEQKDKFKPNSNLIAVSLEEIPSNTY